MGGCNGGDGVKNRKVMAAFLQGGCTLVHEKRLRHKTNSSTNQHIVFVNVNLCTC